MAANGASQLLEAGDAEPGYKVGGGRVPVGCDVGRGGGRGRGAADPTGGNDTPTLRAMPPHPSTASPLHPIPTQQQQQDLDAAIKRGRAAKMQIFAIAQQATAMYRSGDEGGDDECGEGGEGGAAGGGGEDLAGLSDADIEAMDAATLRRLLAARGLPGSGKVSKLRQRLQEARDGK